MLIIGVSVCVRKHVRSSLCATALLLVNTSLLVVVVLVHIGTAAMLVNLASLIVVRVYVSDAAGWLHLCLR